MGRKNIVSPASGVTDGNYVVWDGTSGYVVKEGGSPSGTGTVDNSGTLTNHAVILGAGGTTIKASGDLGTTTKVLHGAAAGDPTWSTVVEADITLADNTTDNVTSTTHGFAPKSAGDATQFLNGAATPAYAAVKDSDLSTTDITTNDVSTTKHGFTPKLPNDATKYLDGTGAYSAPAGSASALVKIAENTPTGTNTTFSSLGAYTHLEIRYSARSNKASVNAEDLLIQFNGDTAGNYDTELIYTLGTLGDSASGFQGLAGASVTIGLLPAATATANRAGVGTIRILDYRGTTFDKGVTSDCHAAVGTTNGLINMREFGGTWRNTAAITSITLLLGSGSFVSGTKFSLYGLT